MKVYKAPAGRHFQKEKNEETKLPPRRGLNDMPAPCGVFNKR